MYLRFLMIQELQIRYTQTAVQLDPGVNLDPYQWL